MAMLSFIQDNNRDELVDTTAPEDADTEANQDQNGDRQEYLAPAEHGKNAKRTTIILVILFTVGSLCIWFMIKKAVPGFAVAAVSAEEAQIENAIAQLTGIKTQMHNRIDQMLGQFYQFADIDQVGVGQLKKNPFRHELYVSDFESLLDKGPDISTGVDLQLWGILQTEQGNCCMINDKMLYAGDWVSGLKVVKIGDKYVELVTANDSPVILKIPE